MTASTASSLPASPPGAAPAFPPASPINGLLDKPAVAGILGVCPGTVDNLRRRKLLVAVKNGSRVLFQPAEVARYIEVSKERRP